MSRVVKADNLSGCNKGNSFSTERWVLLVETEVVVSLITVQAMTLHKCRQTIFSAKSRESRVSEITPGCERHVDTSACVSGKLYLP